MESDNCQTRNENQGQDRAGWEAKKFISVCYGKTFEAVRVEPQSAFKKKAGKYGESGENFQGKYQIRQKKPRKSGGML